MIVPFFVFLLARISLSWFWVSSYVDNINIL